MLMAGKKKKIVEFVRCGVLVSADCGLYTNKNKLILIEMASKAGEVIDINE